MATDRPRRVEYSETTRDALVESAVGLFTEHGYAGTSLDEISRRTRVTKGALYHHFGGKKALFEAALEEVDRQVVARMIEAMTASADPWKTMRSGLWAYLEVCLEPSYQRIVIREGPVVMGWARWREAEERFTYGIVRNVVQNLIDQGEIEPLPCDALAYIVFGSLSAGASTIAESSQPRQTSIEVGQCMERMMIGLRSTQCGAVGPTERNG